MLAAMTATPSVAVLFLVALAFSQIALRAVGQFTFREAALASGAATAGFVILLFLVLRGSIPTSVWLVILPALPASIGGLAMKAVADTR